MKQEREKMKKSMSSDLDLSEEAALKVALSETIQHPFTLIPAVGGGVAGFGLGLLSMVSPPVAIVIVFGGLLAGGANLAFQYNLKGDKYMKDYYDKIHQEFEKLRMKESEKLSSELERLGCELGRDQVQGFSEKFANLKEVYQRVFSENELTYSRFVGTAERGYRAGLENLRQIVTLLINVSDIDIEDLHRKLVQVNKNSKCKDSKERILKALNERIEVYDQSMREVEELLSSNEEALTALDKAGSVALRVKDRTATQTNKENLEQSMSLLREMVNRAQQRYDKKGLSLVE